MIKEVITIYTCQYCRKYYKRKYHGEWHEKHCSKNPANNHKCFQFCKYLEKGYENIEYRRDGTEHATGVTFTCTKTGDSLWSYIAERRRISCDGSRMPLECSVTVNYQSGP